MNVQVRRFKGSYLLNKPLLLLLTLGRCQQRKDRLASFSLYEDALFSVSHDFGRLNAVFPFGRLLTDGVWEIPDNSKLYRNSSGDLLRSELIERNIIGGFPFEIYSKLSNDSELTQTIALILLKKYIPQDKWEVVISKFNIIPSRIDCFIQENGSSDYHLAGMQTKQISKAKAKDDSMAKNTNGFISYLNSLHNLQANGANALAESQALNPYFGEIYEPFPLIDGLIKTLKDNFEKVIILTGHAGDGKSTVALDVLKKLRNLPPANPLGQPLNEREDIDISGSRVTIVKDMSELSDKRRQQWLDQAFSEPGSWLIISNTGPLLDSIVEYAKNVGTDQEIDESKILEYLDRPLSDDLQDKHILDGFSKKLLILNLTRLDNVDLGAKILTKLVKHSAWEQCNGCSIESACPLMLNRKAMLEAGPIVEERVRWIYQRLHAYEKRLTLRQIVAQLAIGLTGGMSCEEAQQQVATSVLKGPDRGTAGLEHILFSESFFGYRSGKPWPQAEGLHAIALLRRSTFGAPVAVNFERSLSVEAGISWAMLPPSLAWIGARWRQRAGEPDGVNWRFALRRMAYLFGKITPGREGFAATFLDTFLQSPSLRDLDQWKAAGKLTLSFIDINRLRTSCLQVLLEIFSGFSAGQFRSKDSLYLTMCRSDKAVVQSTQLVSESLPFKEFKLRFDQNRHTPALDFSNGKVELSLTLPLLDYIRRRDSGELGNELSPIHQSQLDWFRAELLRVTSGTKSNQDQIDLLQVGIDGEVCLYQYFLDKKSGILEQCC